MVTRAGGGGRESPLRQIVGGSEQQPAVGEQAKVEGFVG